MTKDPQDRRRTKAWLSLPAALSFSASVLLVTWLLDGLNPTPGGRLTLLLAPLPLFLLFGLATFRSFAAYDERQRSLLIEALTFGFLLTFFTLIVAHGLRLVGAPVWHNADAWPYVAFTGYVAGYWSAVKRQLR